MFLPICTAWLRYLHSTMFLLIRWKHWLTGARTSTFTFHNVSINTDTQKFAFLFEFEFTFHNVSINTVTAEDNYVMKHTFTFHNVSINTKEKNILYLHFTNLHSTMFLLIRRKEQPSSRCNRIYIPQCFY